MNKFNKVRIILQKIIVIFLVFILIFLGSLYFALQTEGFQTWAADKVTSYLSKELNANIKIDKVKISFINRVELGGVYISDQQKDTLLFGETISLKVSNFSWEKKQLKIDQITLNQIKLKCLKKDNESDFNFQYLIDYFSPKNSLVKDTISPTWKVDFDVLNLRNVDFVYHVLNDTNSVGVTMNYQNIHAYDISGTFSKIKIDGDTISSEIYNLSAKETCGFELKNLTTSAKISPSMIQCDQLHLKTANSLIVGDLNFNTNHWDDYSDFVNKVKLNSQLKDSTFLNFKDIGYFTSELNGFKESIAINGQVNGYVNNLVVNHLHLKYRNNTCFDGDISIKGLPNIDSSLIKLTANNLSVSKSDIEKSPLPPFKNPKHIDLPAEMSKLGVITYKGKFDGYINNFIAQGVFKTDIGLVKTDLKLDNRNKVLEYTGGLTTTNLNLAKLFDNSLIGAVSLSAKVKGKGITVKDFNTTFDGLIQSVAYNDYVYRDIKLEGLFRDRIFTGNIISKDTNANFDFNGAVDFTNKIPKMDFISTINNFDLQKTHFATSQLNGKVSSQILINLSGSSIDNLSGLINFDNTAYVSDGKKSKLSSFNLELDQESVFKRIELNSNIANAKMSGEYKLTTLYSAFTQYLNEYFPTFVKSKATVFYNDKVDLKINIKNFKLIKELFAKDLMISANTLIESSFDASINYLNINTTCSLVEYLNLKFKNNTIKINSLPEGVSFNYNSSSINITDSLSFKNTAFSFLANDKLTNFNLNWDNLTGIKNAGELTGKAFFDSNQAELFFDKFKFVVEDSTWQIVKSNLIVIDTSYQVKVNPITFYNQNQLVTFSGMLSKHSDDKLDVHIQNFKLSQLNQFLENSKLSVEGELSGNTSIYGVFGKTIIISENDFTALKLNNKLIGSGNIKSEYNPEKDFVSIVGYSAFAKDFDGNLMKNIEFDGKYFPQKKQDNISISFKAHPFDLTLLQPYLKDILTFKVGFLNGEGTVTGTIDDPQINAKLKFFKCIMIVDFLNVQYSVNGIVEIKPKQINFENLEIRDKMGNTGIVYGNIFHNNFNDMRIDFDVNTNKLMVLNTTEANNSSYYGTAFASGNAGIYGFLDDIKMELNMKTNGGTYFYIPLDGPSEMTNNEFVKFVTKDTIKTIERKMKSNFSLDFNLEATNDAEIQLIFDEKSGDVIKARGDGLLNMKINSKGKFDMFGDYVLSTGDYLFTLEDFITKKFEIQRGSSIKWNGNVYKANIDIVANYKQRASIKPLFPSDSSNNYNKRFPIDCKLYMKDKLTSPDISFGIELPTIDENSRSTIKSILTDQDELNRQFLSLLLLKSFVTPLSMSGGGGISAGGAAAATGSEMLSNKMSSWLNGITKDVDIGVNYRPGGALSSDELDLALSKQLFNNRLSIDGNFGVSNSNSSTSSTTKSNNSSNLIGDVTVEYKISESGKYRVKGFNRSNDNTEAATNGGPFTQGVGIFYREEYETLNELYKRYIAKFKKKN
jgi:hypothetical protein